MDFDDLAIPKGDWPDFPPGMVWLVGAGPGDPGLMTLEGLSALRRADVVVRDALVDERVLEWRRPGADVIQAGKRGGKPSPKQRDISLKLVELSRQGKRVVRLKGGDPFVFGRGGEEAQTLVQEGVLFRVTPGVSAGIGGLAHAGIPLTHRDVNQTVTFLTGHDQTGMTPSAINWPAISEGSPVIVMYMAIKHIEEICNSLLKAGRDPEDPVALVSNATRADMQVLETTLGHAAADTKEAQVKAPAIVCVGKVVLMRQVLDWASQLNGVAPRSVDPLGNRRIDLEDAS